MRRLPLLVLLAFATTLPAADLDKRKLDAIRPGLTRYVEDRTIAGVVTVVGTSTVSHTHVLGSLRLDPNEAMPANALFRIASMTKPITAVGIMILSDEGKLNVNDPVEKHLPEFKGQMMVATRSKEKDVVVLKKPARPITLRDLLTHTSGLPFYTPGLSDIYTKRNRTLAESVLALGQTALEFEPGSRWAYCNSGIDTLGRVIEVVSGEGYESFLAKRIFEPLGMTDTTFAPNKEQLGRLAGLYESRDGKLVRAPDRLIGPGIDSKHPIPAGGLYSTGKDVARFYQMMLVGGKMDGKQIVSRDAIKVMTSTQTGALITGFTDGMSFGYGFAVVKEPKGVTGMLSPGSYGHGGAFGTQSWADPKKDLFVVLLIQRVGLKNADASDMRRDLQQIAVEALVP